MKFSPTTGCFYPDEIAYAEGAIPTDATEVTRDEFEAAMRREPGATLAVEDAKLVIVPVSSDDRLTVAKARQLAVITAACRRAITGGFLSDALGAPHGYPSSQTDQLNLSASVLASIMPGLPSNWTTPQMCVDGNGAWAARDHSAAEIQQVGVDSKMAVTAALAKKNALAAQIDAAPDVAAVEAITW